MLTHTLRLSSVLVVMFYPIAEVVGMRLKLAV